MDTTHNTQSVIQHHVQSFSENNIDELIKDYSEESEVWSPEGRLRGLGAIKFFFTEIFKLFPAGGTNLELKQMIINNDKAYAAWSSDSPVATIPLGTDTFVIKDNKITLQTLAAHIIMK